MLGLLALSWVLTLTLGLALGAPAFAQNSEKTTTKVKLNVGGLDVSTSVETETESEKEEMPETRLPPPSKMKAPMSDANFKALIAAIKAESFEDDQLEVVALAAKQNFFNCRQVGTLVDTITFEDGKVGVVKYTAPRILDRENAHTILAHFTFSDGKAQAKKLLDR